MPVGLIMIYAVTFYKVPFRLIHIASIFQYEVYKKNTEVILSFRTYRSGQTVQTQISLLLEEQSDQGLHCLLFHRHLFDKIPFGLSSLFEF